MARHLYAEVCQRFRCQVHRLYQGAGLPQAISAALAPIDRSIPFVRMAKGHTEGHDTFDGLTG